jgi:hypothetical protein
MMFAIGLSILTFLFEQETPWRSEDRSAFSRPV